MDESRFDAWTRRRFRLGAVGVVASLLGVLGITEAEGEGKAKHARKDRHKARGDHSDVDAQHKKHKKHKCKKAGNGCNPSNNKNTCCSSLHCQAVPGFGGTRCCSENNVLCTLDQECCSGLCIQGSCGVVLS